jgi:hypothetical protein
MIPFNIGNWAEATSLLDVPAKTTSYGTASLFLKAFKRLI